MDWFNNLLKTSWLNELGLWLWFDLAVVILVVALVIVTVLVLRSIWFVAFWLFMLLPGILIVVIWPDLWFWLIASWVVTVVALIVITAHRGLGVFLTVIATVLALIGGLLGLGFVPTPGDPEKCVVSQESSTPGVHLYFFDEGKQTGASFGTPVSDMTGGDGTFAELHERRSCDPYLTAAHYAAEGFIARDLKNQYAARFNASPSLWGQAIAQMEEKESTRVASVIVDVPAGTWSWCMSGLPDGTIRMYDCSTAADGNALLITFADGSTVSLRLECGFQPTFDSPPGNPSCPPEWGPKCLEPKDPSLSSLTSEGTVHQVNTGTESTVLDEHPQETAEKAEEIAAVDNQADVDAHEDAVETAIIVEETVDGFVQPPPG